MLELSTVVTGSTCIDESADRADDISTAPERNHVRLFDTANASTNKYWVVGDAHHDSYDPICGPFQHFNSDFVGPKRAIFNGWSNPYHHHYDQWGNTAPLQQCGGDERTISSDGFVAVMGN